jgi:GH35 family endo-1,4-beta-xylanase
MYELCVFQASAAKQLTTVLFWVIMQQESWIIEP